LWLWTSPAWVLDAEIHLNINELGETIKEEKKESSQNETKAEYI
jgi:hypothetical protein